MYAVGVGGGGVREGDPGGGRVGRSGVAGVYMQWAWAWPPCAPGEGRVGRRGVAGVCMQWAWAEVGCVRATQVGGGWAGAGWLGYICSGRGRGPLVPQVRGVWGGGAWLGYVCSGRGRRW